MGKKMTPEQTKLLGYTMELDLKAREYRMLCAELEEMKRRDIDPNDEALLSLKKRFEQNLREIKEIKAELQKLNSDDEE